MHISFCRCFTTMRVALLLVLVSIGVSSGHAQAAAADAPAAAPDILIFTNGDQLSGKLLRATGDTIVGSAYGHDPEVLARYLADGLVRQSGWELCFTVGLAPDSHRPLIAISPMIAKTIAKAGVDRDGLRERLFRYARLPAWKMEDYLGAFTNMVPGRPSLLQMHADGLASQQFALSGDPDRLVPIVERAEDILIVVSGDPYRSNALVFGSNGMHGLPTSRVIRRR